jgi:hypothetical protein
MPILTRLPIASSSSATAVQGSPTSRLHRRRICQPASQRLALIFARFAIVIHALAMAIMASRYSGTEVRSSSATHSSTWRLHSSSVSSVTMYIDMVMRFPRNCLINFYHTTLRCHRLLQRRKAHRQAPRLHIHCVDEEIIEGLERREQRRRDRQATKQLACSRQPT